MSKPKNNKLTGPAAAVREIDNQYAAWEQESMQGDHTFGQDRLDAIESIILKHCPDDKSAGKLVEGLRAVEVKMSHTLGVIIDRSDYLRKNYSHTENLDHIEKLVYEIRNNVRAALAEYGELNK